ncbi:MAG TPA: NAD(P)/FAD-dependent oxidoreductase [Candidatus Baltobacteraceae bacterium]|jgi:phytoene dehydrogenase-like protein|nr:NAD(P)/FAD-dependent oxidoreductase [Candidatus Baltobacteraceae bacterium]
MQLPSELDVAVIGAGHNGLTCAALLARAGLRVGVFERSERIGGAAVSEALWNGYTISSASYVCTLLDPWIVETLELQRHGYSAYRKDPATFNVLADGRSLLLGSDDSANEREIAAFDPGDVAGFYALDERIRELGSRLFETFSDAEPDFERFPGDVQSELRGSAAEIVERHVRTPVLAAAVATDGIIGTYLGPRDPGTGYVLAHHYAGRALGVQGAWGFVRGGMGAISNALASAARNNGALLFTNAPVCAIRVDGGAATSVILDDGREISARIIASNAHPRTTFLDLAGERHFDADFVARVQSWETTGCAMKVNFAIGELPDFTCRPGSNPQAHHRATIHVAPSIDYIQTAFEDARAGSVSTNPMLECFLQTPTDPSLAPPGKHILSVFAQYFPYDRPGGWTAANREAAADRIVELLGQFAPNVPAAIEARQILTPADLESRFGLIGGHIFHGELLPGQIYQDRFAVRTPLQNLYLCGSGAHPGGCVSGLPGKRAASAIAAELHVHAR